MLPWSMTVFRHDYDLLAGMPASAVALSCAGTISGIVAVWTRRSVAAPGNPDASGYPPSFRPISGRVPRPEARA